MKILCPATHSRMLGELCVAIALLAVPVFALAKSPPDADVARLAPWFMPDEFSEPKLSPTGEYLGFIVRDGDNYGIGIFEFSTGKISLAGGSSKMLPTDYWWKGPRRLLVKVASVKADGGAMAAFDIDGKNSEDLWRLHNTAGVILDPLPAEPTQVLMAHSAEVFRLDLGTGKTTKVAGDLGNVHHWLLDARGRVRAATRNLFDGTSILWWNQGGGGWRSSKTAPGNPGFRPIAFDQDPRFLWVWDFTASPAIRLSKFDTNLGTLEPIIGSPGLDPTRMLLIERTRQPVAAVFSQTSPLRMEPLTESTRSAVNLLQERFAGYFPVIVDALPDGRNWVVWASNSRFPGAYFLFDHHSGKTTLIATSLSSAINQDHFVAPQSISVESRRGEKITGRLWLPKGAKNPPLIVLCPAILPAMPAEDLFNPYTQAWAASGYAVAIFDGRGTVGYGRNADVLFLGSINRTIQEDLEDGVAGLAAQGMIDDRRVALCGFRLGGAISLAIAETSTKFRAVVSINAPIEVDRDDLLVLSEQSSTNIVSDRLGGWRQSAKIAKALSPIDVAPRVRIPSLHLMDEARWKPGKLSDHARRLERALKGSSPNARVESAHTWAEGFTPPSTLARDRASIALRVIIFLDDAMPVTK